MGLAQGCQKPRETLENRYSKQSQRYNLVKEFPHLQVSFRDIN